MKKYIFLSFLFAAFSTQLSTQLTAQAPSSHAEERGCKLDGNFGYRISYTKNGIEKTVDCHAIKCENDTYVAVYNVIEVLADGKEKKICKEIRFSYDTVIETTELKN